jgi:tetratricopeptide (TPR) repeat protein
MCDMQDKYKKIFLYLLLALAILILYRPVRNFDFIGYDDNMYVLGNPQIQRGLTHDAVIWAFHDFHTGHWHPLTWFSHILDWQLFGYNAGGHHWTNLLFHLFNTLLLFFLLDYMTGEMWKSVFVAALFAVHPLNVESVAWVAERKNVLSTFLWLVTMAAYVRYVKHPGLWRYIAVALLFALGLMAKPMLVTMPFILLLLDYWPLKRFPSPKHRESNNGSRPFFSLLWEKVPLFILSLFSSLITLHAAAEGNALRPLSAFPIIVRMENTLVSIALYLKKMMFPHDLAVFYPFPADYPLWEPVIAAFLLGGITLTVLWAAKRCRYLAVGWFWYLITLMPVIGIIQVGAQSMADRYVYVPYIGLFIILAWGAPDILKRWHYRSVFFPLIMLVILSMLGCLAWRQLEYWKDAETVFRHAVEVTEGNYLAHNNLGAALARKGKFDAALIQYEETLRIKPQHVDALFNRGEALTALGRLTEAERSYEDALRVKPDLAEAHNNLGIIMASRGKVDEAAFHFVAALRIRPDYKIAGDNLRFLLQEQKKAKKPGN